VRGLRGSVKAPSCPAFPTAPEAVGEPDGGLDALVLLFDAIASAATLSSAIAGGTPK
jgi:hypothetical protein